MDVIAAEDTRVTRKLLTRHGIKTPLVSFHEHTPPTRRAGLVARLEHEDVAIVTDGGTPGLSDPGSRLVADAAAAGHTVIPVPGPSAVAAALSVSGLAGESFLFLGFLPRRQAERRSILETVAGLTWTLVAYEAPHRLDASLADLAAILPGRSLVIARELTKIHEEIWRGTTDSAPASWSAREKRGELTLIIEALESPVASRKWSAQEVRTELTRQANAGAGAREASRTVAPLAGWSARDVYRLWPHG